MRALTTLLVLASLAACSSDGDGGGLTPPPTGCTVADEKEFVYQAMLDWYLWNDRLPESVNLADYATAEDLLAYLVTFRPETDTQGNPIPVFSSIRTIEADTQFFEEGEYEGYGFGPTLGAGQTDWQLERVFVDSPAYRAGLRRGQRIIALNGRSIADIQAAEGTNAVLANGSADFTVRNIDGSEFTVTIAEDTVTIDAVPQWGLIDRPGNSPVGYIELVTFISTASSDPENLTAAFQAFADANVNDVILDLRYNRGGLVSTAELLADYLGGFVAENLVFSSTEFNADRAAEYNTQTFFSRLANSLALSRLVVISTRENTASASELVANGMDPHVSVGIVGDRTLGKPVGQVGLDFCEKRLRPTSFKTVNANGFGDYFGGLPADCLAADDLNFPVGDPDNDPNMIAALTWLETGGCPVAAAPGAEFKVGVEHEAPRADLTGPAHRALANAH